MRRRMAWPTTLILTLVVGALGGCEADPLESMNEASPDGGPADSGPVDPTACLDPAYDPGPCMPGEGRQLGEYPATHISEPDEITWEDSPPASGPHRPAWARWGEYSYLPPERWLHNLEHGGVALLYHPCAPAETIDALRAIAQARPDDDRGFFRWVMTPYADLPSAVAVVAWEWRYLAPCVDADEIGAFIDRNYRQAPEDVQGDGSFEDGWIGR